MLKSLRRKKTRDGGQHNSMASSLSGRTSTTNSMHSSRNFFGDVIVISTADNHAVHEPLAPPPAQGLSPSPPSLPFARPPKAPSSVNSSHNSFSGHGDGPPSLGMGDKLLPDESNFRSSLILPHLERRFSLMNTISPEAMRSQLRAQRARAQEKHRPFLTEDEEEEIIQQLQVRIEANAKARGDEVPGKGKLGILLPPINDHPWDSVIERGTDGFGGHIPIYATSTDQRKNAGQDVSAAPQPPLPSEQVSPKMGNAQSFDAPLSPSRRESDDRAVGSLFSSRGARADAAYIRNVAKQRGSTRTNNSTTPNGAGTDTADSSFSMLPSSVPATDATAAVPGKPPTEPVTTHKIGREDILTSARNSTSSNRPSLSALQMSPSQPVINIVADDEASAPAQRRSANPQSLSPTTQGMQRQSRLLTTLSPEAFRRVSTALDELFDHFRAEAGVSPVDDESEAHQTLPTGADTLTEMPEVEDGSRPEEDASQEVSSTAPLSIRNARDSTSPKTREGPWSTGTEDEMGAFGTGPGVAMPGGFGFPTPATSYDPAQQYGQHEWQSATRSSSMAFPMSDHMAPKTSSIKSRNSISSANPPAVDTSPPPKHTRTFSIDSYGSSASSMARYGLMPPNMPAKRTSSLPKRERKVAKEREAAQAKASASGSPQLDTLSEKQRGKQRAEDPPVQSASDAHNTEQAPASDDSGGVIAPGIDGLASAIGSGAMAVAAATTAALTSIGTLPQPRPQHDNPNSTGDTQPSQTPRATAVELPRMPGSQPFPNIPLPAAPAPAPRMPMPAVSPRPHLDHTRGASTFSQMSFTSADSFQSAEEGGTTSGGSVVGGKLSDDGSQSRGSVGSHAFELIADPLKLGTSDNHLTTASLMAPPTVVPQVRAPSAAGSVDTASGRGSFIDDEVEPDDEDAFRYDRRATLRPAPRSPASPGLGSSDTSQSALVREQLRHPQLPSDEQTLAVPGGSSPLAGSVGTITMHASPVLSSEPMTKDSPTFGPSDAAGNSQPLPAAQLGSPFPDARQAESSGDTLFQSPTAGSAGNRTADRSSQQSGQMRPPAVAVGMGASSTGSSHRRGTSTSSVTSFSGEASLIGAQNIGNRRRSSTLSSRILPPTSAATTSYMVPASMRSSVASGNGMLNGSGVNGNHVRGRSGSVDEVRSTDSGHRGATPTPSSAQKYYAPEISNGEPMNLAGPMQPYSPRGRPIHIPGSSGSSYGHQRFGSATATQLSFDPANGRIRVGPNVPNAYTFAPNSSLSGPPPVVMTHSASGTVTAPVIDSPQSPPSLPPSGLRQAYSSTETTQNATATGPTPLQGPVPMMQMSPQQTLGSQAPSPQSTFANIHRRLLSNKGSNSSLNRTTSGSALGAVSNMMRPSSTTSSNGGVKTPSSAGQGGPVALASGFSPSTGGSHASTGQRSPQNYPGAAGTPSSLSREPSDASHASRWARAAQGTVGNGPPSAYQTHMAVLTRQASEVSLSSSLAAHVTSPGQAPPVIGHHSSNPSIASSIRGTPASTTVLTAGAIAARNAQNYGPQYHRTRARSNSGSSAVPNGGSSVQSPAGLGLAGFFTPSPSTTPGSPGIQQVMALQAQQNAAAAAGFRVAASAAQGAVADNVNLPTSAPILNRRQPPGPINPPGFSFPAKGSASQDNDTVTDLPRIGQAQMCARGMHPHARHDFLRSDPANPRTTQDSDQKSIRSVSDINASSEDEVQSPALGRMSTGEDVWATVARNTSMKRTQQNGRSNTPGSRIVASKAGEGVQMRKRSQDLLSANTAEASIPLHTDSSVLTAEQLAEIQTALARSESQRSNSRAGAPSRQAFSPPPIPSIPDAIRSLANTNSFEEANARPDVVSPASPATSTPFFSPREELSQSSAMRGGFDAGDSAIGLKLERSGPVATQEPIHTRLQSSEALQAVTAASSGPLGSNIDAPVRPAPPTTHIAVRTPVLASSFKSEVMYDVTTSHRPTSPTFSHRSKRSDLPSLLDLTSQSGGFRPISPVHDLDEHALSLSQAIDEANARQIEFTFPAMHDRAHKRGNSSIDSRFSGRAATNLMPSPGQQGAVGTPEAIQEESFDTEAPRFSSSSRSGMPRRSKSHDQISHMASPILEDAPKTAASEAHAPMAARLVDDVAAQTRAATRALKGPEENAQLAVPKRSRTLSKRKSQKKLNKIISQPSLIVTSQRLDHAVDIKTPDVWLARTHTQTSQGSSAVAQKMDTNGKTLHRRHSSSFGHSGEFKEHWDQRSSANHSQAGSSNHAVGFPQQSPTTPSGSINFGSKIFGKLRTRKRTGEPGFFDKFTSPAPAIKSTAALTKSPASSFGHATLGPEPMSMMDEPSDSALNKDPDPFRSGMMAGINAPPAAVNNASTTLTPDGGRIPRNMPQADRDNRLRLVSALSFGSPLDQTITESIVAHLGALPEEKSAPTTEVSAAVETNVPVVASFNGPNEETSKQEQPTELVSSQPRIPRSTTTQTLDGTKSARDTIVRRTIIIPTDSSFEKRKSMMSMAAKRKSRAAKAPEDRELAIRNLPPSPEPQLNRKSTDSKGKRDSGRKSIQDRPPTPPGAAGVGNLHRRKISADMLADQPLPITQAAKDAGVTVSSSNQSLSQKRGFNPSASMVSLLAPGNADRLAPPVPSPATPSIYSQGNGSLYDFYMNDDDDADVDAEGDADDRAMQPSPSMENSMRNHIEVTERADGSVVWQVIAGLAERSSVYSDDPRLSYLSGGSRTRDSAFFRGGRVESVYIPESNEKTVSGLDAEDSRSFFAPKRGGHRKSFSYENQPVPALPSAYSSSQIAEDATEQIADEEQGRPSLQHTSPSKHFSSPIGFDMATTTGPSTRIVYTNDSDLAQLLESFAQGKDSAKFDFVKSNQGGPSETPDVSADHSRQRVEAEIYTLLKQSV